MVHVELLKDERSPSVLPTRGASSLLQDGAKAASMKSDYSCHKAQTYLQMVTLFTFSTSQVYAKASL